MKDKRNLLIAALVFAIVIMSVGYSALSANLNINGTATIGDWDVEIVSINSSFTGDAKNKTEPTYTATSASFDASLATKGDTATYTITVENKGSIDAKLSSISLTPAEGTNLPIKYTIVSQPSANDVLEAGHTTTVVIRAEYDSTFTGTLTEANKSRQITGILEYVQDK